ncbi:polysaccharide pyruvyl transferase family protein [Palleronia sediminis]|uniref:Polysaccharide pyruvyl transferase family protein n=1 Tax=Palleronia sediminis TaxID=2547833 RepID=A0A4R6ADV9_9RHOB|nr:polysaccharide pyruvyl transferase family protein [Palleronia sediminis]TDL81114.1 polysaccharide pyruvyl transferase family protein [Palleronia sediminis]
MPNPHGPVIRCFNVKYSPNLGDGLLSECLEAELRACGAAPGTASVDLAARTGWGQGTAGRGLAMATLDALPGPLRGLAVRAPLAVQARRRWRPHYARGLDGADAVAIGGGNLLSDHDLNFPTKLALALETAGARGLPTAIFACGMAGEWSVEGLRRIRTALRAAQPCAVFLRDDASCARWDALLAEAAGCAAQVVRDPGLMARHAYPRTARAEGAGRRPRIGLGIMSHVAIRYHAQAGIGPDALRRWYVDLATRLTAAGAGVTAFTNGAPEDVAQAEALRPALSALPGVEIAARPATPAVLAALIAGCDAIAAYRMHAVIAAHSFAVPALALAWDDKLAAFMQSVGRGDWLADPACLSPEAAARRLRDAAASGLPEDETARVVDEARRDVGRLYAALCRAREMAAS